MTRNEYCLQSEQLNASGRTEVTTISKSFGDSTYGEIALCNGRRMKCLMLLASETWETTDFAFLPYCTENQRQKLLRLHTKLHQGGERQQIDELPGYRDTSQCENLVVGVNKRHLQHTVHDDILPLQRESILTIHVKHRHTGIIHSRPHSY